MVTLSKVAAFGKGEGVVGHVMACGAATMIVGRTARAAVTYKEYMMTVRYNIHCQTRFTREETETQMEDGQRWNFQFLWKTLLPEPRHRAQPRSDNPEPSIIRRMLFKQR